MLTAGYLKTYLEHRLMSKLIEAVGFIDRPQTELAGSAWLPDGTWESSRLETFHFQVKSFQTTTTNMQHGRPLDVCPVSANSSKQTSEGVEGEKLSQVRFPHVSTATGCPS